MSQALWGAAGVTPAYFDDECGRGQAARAERVEAVVAERAASHENAEAFGEARKSDAGDAIIVSGRLPPS